MILRAVHEAHGFEGSERPINGSGPRVLWTLGGGSKANYIHPLSGVLRTGYAAPRSPSPETPLKLARKWLRNGVCGCSGGFLPVTVKAAL